MTVNIRKLYFKTDNVFHNNTSEKPCEDIGKQEIYEL